MPSIIKKKFTQFFSSDPSTGAVNVSLDGSSFTINLNHPLAIPQNALDVNLSVIQANVWNVSPNIAAQFNNNVFNFTHLAVNYNIIIPDGLYSLSGLNSFLSTQFVNLGLPANLITLSGDESTSRTILTFLNSSGPGNDTVVDFTVANSCREILGFDSNVVPTAPQAAGYNLFSDNTAAFNRVNSFVITSDIVSMGIPINSLGANVITSIPINVSPGSQITYEPQNPLSFSGMELAGNIKNTFSFQLRDQSLRLTPTAGELFSLVILFEYTIQI